jgi:hypothetical protein
MTRCGDCHWLDGAQYLLIPMSGYRLADADRKACPDFHPINGGAAPPRATPRQLAQRRRRNVMWFKLAQNMRAAARKRRMNTKGGRA